MTIQIIGSGMAGLLAANMLRHRAPQVVEAQASLPNNHSAVLRFRSPIVGDVLNIPFRKVTMIKTHIDWLNPVADALAYSFKNGGTYRSDRSIIAGTTVAERFISPPDLIKRMAKNCDIKFNQQATIRNSDLVPIISTMPMLNLMKLLGYRDIPEFNYVSGMNIKAQVEDCEAYVSLLIPDPGFSASRISITGNELIIEIPNNKNKVDIFDQLAIASEHLGIDFNKIKNAQLHEQKYAKIMPIDDAARKNFLFWATDKFSIFSLGRFATWRPGLLLDDLVNDVRKIDRWLNEGKYSIAQAR